MNYRIFEYKCIFTSVTYYGIQYFVTNNLDISYKILLYAT